MKKGACRAENRCAASRPTPRTLGVVPVSVLGEGQNGPCVRKRVPGEENVCVKAGELSPVNGM